MINCLQCGKTPRFEDLCNAKSVAIRQETSDANHTAVIFVPQGKTPTQTWWSQCLYHRKQQHTGQHRHRPADGNVCITEYNSTKDNTDTDLLIAMSVSENNNTREHRHRPAVGNVCITENNSTSDITDTDLLMAMSVSHNIRTQASTPTDIPVCSTTSWLRTNSLYLCNKQASISFHNLPFLLRVSYFRFIM